MHSKYEFCLFYPCGVSSLGNHDKNHSKQQLIYWTVPSKNDSLKLWHAILSDILYALMVSGVWLNCSNSKWKDNRCSNP